MTGTFIAMSNDLSVNQESVMKYKFKSIVGAFFLGVATMSQGATITINSVDTGWYMESGLHVPTNVNYLVGDYGSQVFRDFFVFDTSTIAGTITSAKLRAYNSGTFPGFASHNTTETWALFDILTPLSSLLAGTGGIDAFVDLGSGSVYGSQTVSSLDNGQFVEVSLNSTGLAALAGGGLFGIGGAITALDGLGEQHLFAASQLDGHVELVITTSASVSEPATPLLLGAALVGIGFIRRRKHLVS